MRDPVDGCDWDRVQTFATIAPYTIEEAYEVADAIAADDPHALKDELGDLLFQVVLLSRIAEQSGLFALDDVADAIANKMVRRHPHLFGDAAVRPDWETMKASERGTTSSVLDGVAFALPALMRAEKLQKRAARTGFDWPDLNGPLAKITEELAEVAAATTAEERSDEVGDLIFAVVNYARHLGVDPEVALRALPIRSSNDGSAPSRPNPVSSGSASTKRKRYGSARNSLSARHNGRKSASLSRTATDVTPSPVSSLSTVPCACNHASVAPSPGSTSTT